MVNTKKILTSIEPIIEKSTPVLQSIYNSIKEAIQNIITPPKAGNETTPLKEPLIKKVNSFELINLNNA